MHSARFLLRLVSKRHKQISPPKHTRALGDGVPVISQHVQEW